MPSLEYNIRGWARYDWSNRGDEWSQLWGGTENLWRGSIEPRIRDLIPAGHILEIAPGFGRATQYLKDQCETMTLVDLTERCIDACRERFADDNHLRYVVNDGKSLPGVEDKSIDFVFTWDSLVHVEMDIMECYIAELARVLTAEGTAFIHHSNVAPFRNPDGEGFSIEIKGARGQTVSAELVRKCCDDAGLVCYKQELINWSCDHLIDTFSFITRKGSSHDRTPEIVENPGFMDEARRIGKMGWRHGYSH